MFRIAVNQQLGLGQQLTLAGEEHHYLTKVLRLKEDDEIIVFNEAGEYISSVLSQSKKGIILKITDRLENDKEAKSSVVLAFGYPKGEKIDLVVQKATELGISELWPVITMRSVVKLDEKKMDKKIERLEKIAQEATEQSGRLKVPKIRILPSLKAMNLEIKDEDMLIIPWEQEKETTIPLETLKEIKGRIIIFIGPEGGIDPKELEVLKSYTTITLGKRILRAETACIAATTIIMYNLGELGGN